MFLLPRYSKFLALKEKRGAFKAMTFIISYIRMKTLPEVQFFSLRGQKLSSHRCRFPKLLLASNSTLSNSWGRFAFAYFGIVWRQICLVLVPSSVFSNHFCRTKWKFSREFSLFMDIAHVILLNLFPTLAIWITEFFLHFPIFSHPYSLQLPQQLQKVIKPNFDVFSSYLLCLFISLESLLVLRMNVSLFPNIETLFSVSCTRSPNIFPFLWNLCLSFFSSFLKLEQSLQSSCFESLIRITALIAQSHFMAPDQFQSSMNPIFSTL